jgi:hypothetical protein
MAWIRTTLSLTSLVLVLLWPSYAQQPAQATSAPAADATRRLLTKSGTLRLLSKTEADIDGVDATNKPAKLIFHLDTSTKCDQVKVGDVVSIIYRTDGSDFTAVRIALMVATTSGSTGPVGGNAKSNPPAPAAKPQSTTASAGKGIGALTGLGYGGATTGGLASRGSMIGTPKSGATTVAHTNDGAVTDLHDVHFGLDIRYNIGGTARVSVERPDHSRTVSEGRNHGYVQRPYVFRGGEYAHRTYYTNGKFYDLFYIRYAYRGTVLDVYTPSRFYPAAFYDWFYNPWPAPIAYSWGWASQLWFGQSSAVFTPFPVYPTAAYWLTDYLIAESLQSYYGDANPEAAASSQPAFTPEIKLALAEEIKRYIALEQLEATTNAEGRPPDPGAGSVAATLTGNQSHVLISGSDFDALDSSQTRCAISPGDVLQLAPATLDNPQEVPAVVLVSKQKECPKSAQVHLALTDLQDMQNYMRATIDRGLDEFHSRLGTLGLPSAPTTAQAAAAPAAFTVGAPLPEQDVAAQIFIQQPLAEAYEKSLDGQSTSQAATKSTTPSTSQGSAAGPSTSTSSSAAAAAGPPDTGKSPATISIQETIDDVVKAMGKPEKIINLGTKTIYVYKDIKVTFTDGKVTNVE